LKGAKWGEGEPLKKSPYHPPPKKREKKEHPKRKMAGKARKRQGSRFGGLFEKNRGKKKEALGGGKKSGRLL